MKNNPVYVELNIHSSLDELWRHTQIPQLHEQWDLRFSEIEYLPRSGDSTKQMFRYTTRIGFGLKIKGIGETSSQSHDQKKERLSTLLFSSSQPISLISTGGGYWKYKENNGMLTFSTRFDYKTRFGAVGSFIDRILFRPVFGYATAWSFDRLRIWLEEKVPPSIVAERAFIHYLSVLLLMLLWCFEGLVPKLLSPAAGELKLMRSFGLFEGQEITMIYLIGITEIVIGLLTVYGHRNKWTFYIQILLLLTLTVPMLAAAPDLMTMPFNPVTLAAPMIGLSLIAIWSSRHLPQPKRCKRK
ncbi:DoxX-like family protein [Paenibacillus sp. 2TAB23]|uniref:DoxX-like family protein n=1 Tax=Paenibacillus sp. 2TAB23 TaxID=3233004 RepID=UPI003F944859